MANAIISQDCTKCNIISKLFNSSDVSNTLAAEILSGTNEKALDILRMYGFDGFIDGTFYAPEGEVIKLFGVKKEYLRGVLTRLHIIKEQFSDDILKLSISDFLDKNNLEDRYQLYRPDDNSWTVYDKLKQRRKTFAYCCPSEKFNLYRFKETFYSARLILAMPAFLDYGRRVIKDGTISKIYELLKSTSYYEPALNRAREYGAKIHRECTIENARREIVELTIKIKSCDVIPHELIRSLDFYYNDLERALTEA